jgi:DNA mismatch endonuclease, patch repair protein
MDRLTAERRSALMSRIRGTNTKLELTVRSALHALGYRYRLHVRGLPGTPDLVFPSRGRVLFVHGCFWHGHCCKYGLAQPKSNSDYWESKLKQNMRRDARAQRRLRAAGWRVGVVWECRVRSGNWLNAAVRFLDA